MNKSTIAILISPTQEWTITDDTKQQEVQDWLAHHLQTTKKVIQDSAHLRSINHGFEIQFQNGKLYTFFAYFRSDKISCCEFPLRFGINKGWTIKGAAMYLGEPSIKSKRAVEIIYPHLGLGLVFGGTWSNENSLISYAYFYAPQNNRVCASCSKQFATSTNEDCHLFNKQLKIHICKCEYVSYCSQNCVKKHYGQHLIFCEIGQL